jgi:hypothetical protein
MQKFAGCVGKNRIARDAKDFDRNPSTAQTTPRPLTVSHRSHEAD